MNSKLVTRLKRERDESKMWKKIKPVKEIIAEMTETSIEMMEREIECIKDHITCKTTEEEREMMISERMKFIENLKLFDYKKFSFLYFLTDVPKEHSLICPSLDVWKLMKDVDFETTKNWILNEFERIIEMEFIEALKDYTEFGYKRAWNYFEGKTTVVDDFILNLDYFYKTQMTSLPKNMILFEGLGVFESIEKWEIGKEYIQKRPISTSVHPQSALSFCSNGGNLLKYTVTGNVKGFPIQESFSFNSKRWEQEIHLRPNTKIKILNKTKQMMVVRSLYRWGIVDKIININVIEAELLEN
jgi:hypothetical protein